ncbi:MAG: formyltetrahydrofolate deformylase, partial [Methylophagaceae bacterium]
MNAIIFLIQCPDQKGLVAGITSFFAQRDFNILHCQQYTDVQNGQYFMRVKLEDNAQSEQALLEQEFTVFANSLGL